MPNTTNISFLKVLLLLIINSFGSLLLADDTLSKAEDGPVSFSVQSCVKCPVIEIIVSNSAESDAKAQEYISTEAAKFEHISVNVFDSSTEIDRYEMVPINENSLNLLKTDNPNLKISVSDLEANSRLSKFSILKKLPENSFGVITYLPHKITESWHNRTSEEKVYTLVRTGLSYGLTIFISSNAGLDPWHSAYTIALVGAAYTFGTQFLTAKISEFLTKSGFISLVKFFTQPKGLTAESLFHANRWTFALIWPTILTVGMDMVSGMEPTISPEEWAKIISTATKSTAAGFFWSKFTYKIASQDNLSKNDEVNLARFSFFLSLAGAVIVAADLAGLEVSTIGYGLFAGTGFTTYYLGSTIKKYWTKSISACHRLFVRSITLL